MFGISMGELVLILLAAFIVVGPGRLPGLARMLGRFIRHARKALRDLSDAVEDAESPDKTGGPGGSLVEDLREAGRAARNLEDGLKEKL
ncbi:MAG: twin-arginine translocase TatA/TatE family subunit [Spirochaetaceae bacterium]|jgi:Sec-independent protein translocase protein TatA|nr:twin-arginine translocase TatA/TatE family subunit [Spirochaetaceae bacterium]